MRFRQMLSSKNFQNSFWNVTEVLLTPLIFFVSIPIFLKQLGVQDYGIWMFVNAVVVFMQLFNLGLNFSVYKHVSVAISTKSNSDISKTLNTNLSLTSLIFIFCLFLCGMLSWGIHSFDWFATGISNTTTLIQCLFLGMGILFAKLIEQILYNVYRAFEDFKYVTILTIFIKTITVLGNLFLAFYTHNIVYIFTFTLVMIFIGVATNYRLVKRFIPFYTYQWSFNKKLISNEINYSLFIWLQSIAVIIAFQGDRLLVSFGFGLATLSFYAVVATLFNHIHMAFAAILAWLFPQIAKNKEEIDRVYLFYLNSRNILISISVVLLGLFCLLSEFVFTLWLGADNYLEIKEYVRWFSVFEFFFVFNIAPHFFLNAADFERFSLKMVGLYTSIIISGMLLGYFLVYTPRAIVVGLAVATAISMVIFQFQIARKFSINKVNIFHLILLFVPSTLGAGIPIFDSYSVKFLFFILSVSSIYFIFIRFFKTNFKPLIQ